MKNKSGLTSTSPTMSETWQFSVIPNPEIRDCYTAYPGKVSAGDPLDKLTHGTGTTPLEAIASLVIKLGSQKDEMWFMADTLIESRLFPGIRRAR